MERIVALCRVGNSTFIDVVNMNSNYLTSEYCDPFDEKIQNFFMKLEHCGRYLYALDHITNRDSIADIACATGYGADLLASKAYKVIGCDINDSYLAIAKTKYIKNNLSFVKVDLQENLGFLENNLSTIVSFETIEHLINPFEQIQKFYDVLPINGRLFLSFLNSLCEQIDETGKSMDPFHLSVINYQEMLDYLIKTGFKINKILGQSLINKIFAQVLDMENDFGMSFDAMYNYSRGNIIKQSRVLAYPNEADLEKSYSFLFDLTKIVR